MDAHLARNARWTQQYSLDKIKLTMRGYSRAAFRTGFYIPELNIMLDAGPQNFNKPSHMFITHCHIDHIGELPYTLIGDEEGNHIFDIFGPPTSQKYVADYINSFFSLNALCERVPTTDWYKYTEFNPDEDYQMEINKSRYSIKVIKCDHTVPTISYLFSVIRAKLKPEYLGLPGKEIAQLRKKGTEICQDVIIPQFAYICDCSIETIQNYEAEIFKQPYLIVECTFLYEDEYENAQTTKHIHWLDLQPYIKKYSETVFILIHFSLRYKDDDILSFFEDKKEPNMVIWVGNPS